MSFIKRRAKPKRGGELVNRSAWDKFKRLMRLMRLRILRLRTSAHSIALGVALGVFIGFMPIIPFQSFTVLALALVFRANKLAAFLCTFFTNVFTMIPFYALFYLVGSFFLSITGLHTAYENMDLHQLMEFFGKIFDPRTLDMREMLSHGSRFFFVMTLGGTVLGVPSSVGMYFLTRKAVLSHRRRRALRLMRKRETD